MENIRENDCLLKNQHNIIKLNENVSTLHGSVDKCREWLDNCSLSDAEHGFSDGDDKSLNENLKEFNDDNNNINQHCFRNETSLEDVIGFGSFIDSKSSHTYQNVLISKSENVHLGDVTNINGPVYINQINQLHRKEIVSSVPFTIVPRRTWLAQPPATKKDILYFKDVPKFAIISHSASEEALTQTANNLNVRLIQQFHIESRQWNDIAYNFLIGADGSAYEGRGWDVIGAHSYKYNSISLGICFIGYYVNELPPEVALNRAKALIKHGARLGKIDENYSLLGHCQCSSTKSPGKALFDEIQTWDHFDGTISLENPSQFIEGDIL